MLPKHYERWRRSETNAYAHGRSHVLTLLTAPSPKPYIAVLVAPHGEVTRVEVIAVDDATAFAARQAGLVEECSRGGYRYVEVWTVREAGVWGASKENPSARRERLWSAPPVVRRAAAA